jgi:hypothetical protein
VLLARHGMGDRDLRGTIIAWLLPVLLAEGRKIHDAPEASQYQDRFTGEGAPIFVAPWSCRCILLSCGLDVLLERPRAVLVAVHFIY